MEPELGFAGASVGFRTREPTDNREGDEGRMRLVRALAVETNENWMEANRYINMDDLREHKKLALRQAA